MTRRNKLLIYLAGILAGYLFTWPFALIILFFFADMDHQIPTKTEP